MAPIRNRQENMAAMQSKDDKISRLIMIIRKDDLYPLFLYMD